MGEYNFTDNLTTLSRYRTPTEAALAKNQLEAEGIEAHLEAHLDGEQSATALGHLGADLVGASLLVRQGDLRRAREVLADLRHQTEEHDDQDDDQDDTDDYEADDWSGEDWADDNDNEEYEEYSEEPTETPPLTRAWRAALIGGLLLPCLVLNIYSVWLIIEHELWQPQPGETQVNWRFPASLLLNLIGTLFFGLIILW